MVIASIDLMNGKAVQLVEGKEKKLERENPAALAQEFARYGEVAVIDLDAAFGNGDNDALIRQLCRVARCRVGGGIGTVKRARTLVSYGAEKIIVGSRVFRDNAVDIPFLKELAQSVGRERVMVAVDARDGEIMVDAWRKKTGLDLLETAAQLKPYVGGLLFTCVQREGRMQGTDMAIIKGLREIYPGPLTAAGGVDSLEEIETLAKMNTDVQLGMALYTGKIKLDEAFITCLNWKTPLLPVITTDRSGQVLMQAYANKEALAQTLKTGRMTYFSRSRNQLWEKGETSGNTQYLEGFSVDCDRDAILATVTQKGPACHEGTYSCFGDRRLDLPQLWDIIAERFANPTPGSYTATLDDKMVREKIMEEAREVVESTTRDNKVWEAADLLYFLTVFLQKENISVQEVLMELQRRRWK